MITKQKVDAIIAELQKLSDSLGMISDLEDRASRAQADLDSVNKTLADAKRDLNDTQMNLTKAHVDAQRRYEQEIYTKQGQLRDLTQRLDARQTEVKQVEDDLTAKRSQANVLDHTVQEAKRRLGM